MVFLRSQGTVARMGIKGLLLGTVKMKDGSAQWVDHIDWQPVTHIGHVAGSCSQAPVFMWNAHVARFPAS